MSLMKKQVMNLAWYIHFPYNFVHLEMTVLIIGTHSLSLPPPETYRIEIQDVFAFLNIIDTLTNRYKIPIIQNLSTCDYLDGAKFSMEVIFGGLTNNPMLSAFPVFGNTI
jgi:hypothetical protein